MTRRREQTIELAEALGIQPAEGEGTTELMDRCIDRAKGRGQSSGREKQSEQTERPRRARKGERAA